MKTSNLDISIVEELKEIDLVNINGGEMSTKSKIVIAVGFAISPLLGLGMLAEYYIHS